MDNNFVLINDSKEVIGCDKAYKSGLMPFPETITIPNGIESIGASAYASCKIQNVILPESIRLIDSSAFAFSSLKNINLPEGLKKIYYNAFSNSFLEKIILPKSLESMSESVFVENYYLCEVKMQESLCKKIPTSCFEECHRLNNIILPDNITDLGDLAFACCYNLQDIKLPKDLENIGIGAFEHCTELANIKLPLGLKTIQAYAFNDTKIKEIDIPGTVKYISDTAFDNNTEKITIPEIVLKNNERFAKRYEKYIVVRDLTLEELLLVDKENFLNNVIESNLSISEINQILKQAESEI